MNIAGPTDVLTFPLESDSRGRYVVGEVILCVPEARRRAKSEGTLVRNELLLYAVHGLLHLCGFDDTTARGFKRMHHTEDQILNELGIGPVFSQAGPSGSGYSGRHDSTELVEVGPALLRKS
jgi:probable rRNA maturation factor